MSDESKPGVEKAMQEWATGRPSSENPGSIPAWYTREEPLLSGGEAEEDVREAVRWLGGDFPIAFLLSDEKVSPARPPQRGVTIGPDPTDANNTGLAVPPGYWVVRDAKGVLALYSDYDFRRAWTVLERQWIPQATREKADLERRRMGAVVGERDGTVTSTGDGTAFAKAVQESAAEVEAARSHREAQDARQLYNDDLPPCSCKDPKGQAHDGWCVRGIMLRARRDERIAAEGEELTEKLVEGEGWMGTPPAEGTRRRRLLDAIKRRFPGHTDEHQLDLADTVESALLQQTIDEEAMGRGAETMLDGFKKVDPDGMDPVRKHCAAQEESHRELRESDPDYAEYHRGAEYAYSIIGKQLRLVPSKIEHLKGICQQRWERIDQLENQLEGVRESLDRLDAPAGVTFALRVDRLYREMRERLERERERANDRDEEFGRLKVIADRTHNLLDGWTIPKVEILDEDEEESSRELSVHERTRVLCERLRVAQEELKAYKGAAPEGKVPAGTRELHIRLAKDQVGDATPVMEFVELEDQDGAGVGGFEQRQDGEYTLIVIPYGRDDEWAQALVLEAIVRAQECDLPFPADVADQLLRDFGITPTRPRTWPHRGERPGAEDVELVDRVLDSLEEKGVDVDREEHPEETTRRLSKELIEVTESADRYHEQREQARAGESTLMEQRNASLNLLRWLIGDLIRDPTSRYGDDD